MSDFFLCCRLLTLPTVIFINFNIYFNSGCNLFSYSLWQSLFSSKWLTSCASIVYWTMHLFPTELKYHPCQLLNSSIDWELILGYPFYYLWLLFIPTPKAHCFCYNCFIQHTWENKHQLLHFCFSWISLVFTLLYES